MPTALENRALAFVAELGRDYVASQKIPTIRDIRESYPVEERPLLRDIAAAVDWALAQPRDFTPYLVDSQTTPSFWRLYKFPNGRAVSVRLDPRPQHPFRFEVSGDGDDCVFLVGSLSTAEVEAKLAEIAALPTAEPNA